MSCIRDNKYDSAYQHYLDGDSLAKVADKLGVTRQAVYDAFKCRGLKLRGPNFQPVQIFDSKKFTLKGDGYYYLTTGNRITIHRYIWEFYNGKIPDGYEIHHIDEDKTNNVLSNYKLLTTAEHASLHGKGFNQHIRKKINEQSCL